MGGAGSKTRARPRGRSSTLADRPTPPGKPLLVPCDKHSPEPDVVTIRWEPPLYDGGSYITGYLVEHRRTGSPHWVRSWPQLVRETELTLSGLEPGWRYQFRVSAQNVVGLSDPGELSDLLTVTLQRTAASAPFFVKELHDTSAIENEKAELSVQVRGTPTPTVAWFKDGVEVFSSRSYRVVTDNEVSTLVIHQASLSDEGEIKCAATNRVGYTFTRAKLLIQAPPNIRLPRQYEEGLLFEKDEVIRLKVSVAGRPVPEVTWALNGEPVPGGGRYEAAHSERYATLRVGEARRSDRGEYTVRAVNILGEDTASFLVTVADKPMPPGRAKVVMTLGRSVTLSWSSPEDDGGCKIGNYIVEYYRLGWNMWLKAATCRQLTTTLGELIEGSEYKFRVKAENPYGVSEPSSESDVVFIPDPKRGLLEPPNHGTVKVEDMDVWLENKKRPTSTSPTIDEQYGERKTKKKRGPMVPTPQDMQTDKHSMMSEDSMSPPATPDRLQPTVPRRRPRLERSDVEMEALEEKELTKKLEERRKVEEFKKFEEIKKAEELRKAEEQKKEEETKQKEKKRLAEIKRKNDLQELPQTPRMQHTSFHGSSELMLVLLPHSRATTEEREASKRELFESSLALEDEIAPPMSLSAPELGTGEPLEPQPMRAAFSSTELLHDRAMARFYQDLEREEAESSLRRRGSLQRRASLERRASRTKASSLQDLLSVTKPIKEEEEEQAKPERPPSAGRKSPRLGIVHGILTSEPVGAGIPSDKNDRKTFSRESMDSAVSTEDVHRKLLVQQTSEEDMEYEDSSFDEDEEDEYDEDEEEPITDDVIEELDEDFEEEDDEEETSTYDKKEPLYTSESAEDALYSYSLEEDIYIPTTVNMKYDEDTMISAYEGRGPLILGSKNQPSTSSAVPKYSSLEGLSNEASSPNGEAKLKPILKRPSADIADKKINECGVNQSSPTKDEEFKNKSVAVPEKRFEPNFNPPTPKPILKVRDPSQERPTPVSLRTETEHDLNRRSPSKANLDESSDYETGVKKKQVRIEEPEEAKLASERRESSSRLVEAGRKKSDSLGEEIDGSRVLISHYSDIVAEYGKTKKTPRVPLYLDYDSLKAAAEKEEENLPPIVPDITVDEPDPEPEPDPESETKTELEFELEPKALLEQEPEPEIEAIPDEIEEPVTLHRHSVHFDLVPEENNYYPKPTEKPRTKSLSILKKRSPSPMKKRSSSPRKKAVSSVDEISEVSVSSDKIEPARTPSPVLPPRLYTNTEKKVHSYIDFMMDLSLFLLACWLYLFKDERLAIPVLFLMIYRQAHDAFLRKMEALRNKLPRRILFWRKDN